MDLKLPATARLANIPGLKRVLGLLDVFCIATGAMLSSGLFVLPGLAYAKAGPSVFLAYGLAGCAALVGLFCQAELVTAMPKAGGDYFYITRALGPAIGTVAGIQTWLALVLKSALALVGMAAFIRLALDMDLFLIEAALVALFVALNLMGIKGAARFQSALVFGLIAALGLYIIRGMPAVEVRRFVPFVTGPNGWLSVAATAGFVFISYGGLLKVSGLAEEVRDPVRVLPRGMFISLFAVVILCMASVYVTVGVLDGSVLSGSLTPLSDGAFMFLGRPGQVILSLAAIFAFVTTANAGIMAASRYPLALARDGLIPQGLARISVRTGVPYVAVLVTGAVTLGALYLELDLLVKVASAVLIITYMAPCLAVMVLRESRILNYQPRFHVPFYPWIPLAGLAGFGVLLFEIGPAAWIATAAMAAVSLCLYWFYGRVRATREYALLHLVERVTARELTTGVLEGELREIIRERDDITIDRFDHIIDRGLVLDLEGPLEMDDLFTRIADGMAPVLAIPPERLRELLVARERESGTAITPGLAIPHVVVEGTGKFDIMLVRCRKGIRFDEYHPAVHAVFMLAGTRDERNFHLRALAAIAQIVEDPAFEKRWMSARTVQNLRDTVLLGRRKRWDTPGWTGATPAL
ncbi:MAG: amino acid permease [Planctomycetota bacterium]